MPASAKEYKKRVTNMFYWIRISDGRVGRAIFINSDLIHKFSGFDSQADLDEAFSRIKQLRATAGGIDSFTNVANPKEHMGIIGRCKDKV